MDISIKNTFQQIPLEVRWFAAKAFFLFVSWKLLYLFYLQPTRLIDRPLSAKVASHTAWFMGFLNPSQPFTVTELPVQRWNGLEITATTVAQVRLKHKKVVGIDDGCNGLEFFVLYIGFILSIGEYSARTIWYGLAGIILIHATNVLRCAGLGWVNLWYQEYFEFAHHYLFKVVVYGTIFGMWYSYLQYVFYKKEQPAT